MGGGPLRGNYAILCDKELVLECGIYNDLAEHIINLHNRSLIENEVELAKDVIRPEINRIIAGWNKKAKQIRTGALGMMTPISKASMSESASRIEQCSEELEKAFGE